VTEEFSNQANGMTIVMDSSFSDNVIETWKGYDAARSRGFTFCSRRCPSTTHCSRRSDPRERSSRVGLLATLRRLGWWRIIGSCSDIAVERKLISASARLRDARLCSANSDRRRDVHGIWASNINLPGRKPDFWLWATDETPERVYTAYLKNLEIKEATNSKLNAKLSRWTTIAKALGVAAPITAIAVGAAAASLGF
jgi:hypothetical protein